MDKSQKTKFRAMLEGIATSTGKTDFLDEILDLSEKSIELLQTLTRVSDERDKVLQTLDEARNLRQVENTLSEYQAKLQKEINQNVELLTSLQKVDLPQRMQQHQAKIQFRAEEDRGNMAPYLAPPKHFEPPSDDPEQREAKIKWAIEEARKWREEQDSSSIPTQHIEPPSESDDDHERIEAIIKEATEWEETGRKRARDDLAEQVKALNETLDKEHREFTKAVNDSIEEHQASQLVLNKARYLTRIAYVAYLISLLRKLFRKYTFERRIRSTIQQAIRILFLLIILTLGVGMLVAQVNLWWLSLLLLPTIAWFLTDRYIQPYLEKRLFTPRKRNDLKALLTEFYNQSILARCYLALAKAFVDKLE
jgi:hypothetical protein